MSTKDRISGPRDKHPSGKSLRRPAYRNWGDGYANREEPKTVRLRAIHNTNAIGFTASLTRDDDFWDDDE